MRVVLALVAILSIAMFSAVPGQAVGSTTINQKVSLSFDERTINTLEIENFHSRSYSDPSMMQKCSLPASIEGVIWRVWIGGAKVDSKEIEVRNENDEPFKAVCWSSKSGSTKIMQDGKVVFEGPTSEFLFAGPDNSSRVRVMFGKATAEVKVPSGD